MTDQRIPVVGCWVRKLDDPETVGQVQGNSRLTGSVEVEWFGRPAESVPIASLGSAFQAGYIVQHVPSSVVRNTLGVASVLDTRRLAEADQVLVQLHNDGRCLWLPYENLRRIMGSALQYRRGQMLADDAGERFVLNLMAHALRTWNDSTGALDRLDVDPLPHQIQLVHKIIASGHTNWVIADDVGLGKTIEVGLLLAALERRHRLRRVLIVTPATLTRQWQDEMQVKFNKHFEIYGHDFFADVPWKWRLHDRVIASLDMIKPRDAQDTGHGSASHFARILMAEAWDLVVFDEAHRLSKTDESQTLRYRLARVLREKSDAILLLTGTPHQGDSARFRNLLQLVRPSLTEQIDEYELAPEIVADIILRNRKIDVTDAEGRFIFKGQTVRRVAISATEASRELERRLGEYFRHGYGAGQAVGGAQGRAIGFVMTIYRKLASSSTAALKVALTRRIQKLSSGAPYLSGSRYAFGEDAGEDADDLDRVEVSDARGAFFESELAILRQLVELAELVLVEDRKLAELQRMVNELVGSERKLVIFTEYRATQDYIVEHLERDLSKPVAVINGSQSLDEKLRNVRLFEAEAPVIVSTEAGGEGLNLHRGCHVLLNYDIPWNPARLVQRIGRIYRYGQTEKVVVINFQATDTIDNQVIDYALTRVATIAREMAGVGAEFRERYEAEILGELLEQLDISDVLNRAQSEGIERSRERVAEAIERARRAQEIENEILSHAGRFDPEALRRLGAFTTRDLMDFICRAAPLMDITVERATENTERVTLRLPEALRGVFPEFANRLLIDATTSRRTWNPQGSIVLLDFSNSFVRYLIERLTQPDANGAYAAIARPDLEHDIVAAFSVRWQNEQGDVTGEELVVAGRCLDGSIEIDNRIVARLFAGDTPTVAAPPILAEQRKERLAAITDRVEMHMAAAQTAFQNPNSLVTLAVADVLKSISTQEVEREPAFVAD
jgi:superfamily II DNA or RNA helicase